MNTNGKKYPEILSVVVPRELKIDLQLMAEQDHRSLSQKVRLILQQSVDTQKEQQAA